MTHDLAYIRELFDEIIQATPEQRLTLIKERCGDDEALRNHLQALITSAEADEPFLSEPTRKRPMRSETPTAPVRSISERPGERIGPYKLLQQIGEGGFGVVFMADQDRPVRRRVALKIIKLGMDTRQIVARFEQERQALALMDHPNIAKVFDAGATDSGRPYFVMEYVKGDPITAFADAHKLTLSDRLELFSQICAAVQHAHTKGIIHRDLKPRNVLVAMSDGKPLARVIDFGIAKATGARLTDMTLFTEHAQLIGTPEYMSPEQAEGSIDIDTRADVYALGVILYELLTGTTPFDAVRLRSAAFAEMQRIIKEEEPVAPSVRLSRNLDTLAATAAARQAEPARLGSFVRGELDWIAMKALEKDRARRYATPNDLATDVQHHLTGDPIQAAPLSVAYRLRKFMRKHRATAILAGAVGAALLLGLAGVSWQWREAEYQRRVAQSERDRATEQSQRAELAAEQAQAARHDAESSAYASNLAFAQFAMANDNWAEARERLDACSVEQRGWEWQFLKQKADSIVATFEGASTAVASPDGSRILVINRDFTARLYGLDGMPIGAPMSHEGMYRAKFSADGMVIWTRATRTVQLWDREGRPIGSPIQHDDWLGSVEISPDNQSVMTVSGNAGTVRLWDMLGVEKATIKSQKSAILEAEFSPDSRVIMTRSGINFVQLWDLDGREVCAPVKVLRTNRPCSFSPDGKLVSTIVPDGSVQLWDTDGDAVGDPIRYDSPVGSARFSPDGKVILMKTNDGRALLLHLQSDGRPTLLMHEPWYEYPVEVANGEGRIGWIGIDRGSALFSPDGQIIMTEMLDNSLRLWNLDGEQIGEPMPHEGWISTAVFSTDSARILTSSGGVVRLWDTTGRTLAEMSFGITDERSVAASFCSNTQVLLSVPNERAMLVRTDRLASPITHLIGEEQHPEIEALLIDTDVATALTVDSPDGSRRVTVEDGRSVRFVDTQTDREVAVMSVPANPQGVAFTQDGTRLVIPLGNGTTQVWDTRDPETRRANLTERHSLRPWAFRYVEALLDGPTPWTDLPNAIADNPEVTGLRRAVASEVLRVRRQTINIEASRIWSKINGDTMSPIEFKSLSRERVSKLAHSTSIPSRVIEVVYERIGKRRFNSRDYALSAWRAVANSTTDDETLALALSAAEEAIRLQPDRSESLSAMGAVEFRRRDFESAFQMLTRALTADDDSEIIGKPDVLAIMSMCQHELGNVTAARQLIDQLGETLKPEFAVREQTDRTLEFVLPSEHLVIQIELDERGGSFKGNLRRGPSGDWRELHGVRRSNGDSTLLSGLWLTSIGALWVFDDGESHQGVHRVSNVIAEAIQMVEGSHPTVDSVEQWALKVINHSSQYSVGAWSANQALGAADTYRYGDILTAWAPKQQNSGIESLQLKFAQPVYATGVTVRETLCNGFVTQIDVIDDFGEAHTVWSGHDVAWPGTPINAYFPFEKTSFLVYGVKIHVDTDRCGTWEEIDAVKLHGIPQSRSTD